MTQKYEEVGDTSQAHTCTHMQTQAFLHTKVFKSEYTHRYKPLHTYTHRTADFYLSEPDILSCFIQVILTIYNFLPETVRASIQTTLLVRTGILLALNNWTSVSVEPCMYVSKCPNACMHYIHT